MRSNRPSTVSAWRPAESTAGPFPSARVSAPADPAYDRAVRFAADASHELITPLALLSLGLEELCDRTDLPLEVVDALSGLLEDAHRMAATCQDMLLYSRANAASLPLDRQPADLGDLVADAVEDARILGASRSIEVEWTAPDRAEERVDAKFLSRILLNLLSNAVKYNQPGGKVRAHLAAEHAVWAIVVENTGPGIPLEHQAKLFERFFRGSPSPHSHGLGLSLSRELARAHGGDLRLVSSDEQWTVFRLTLPRTCEQTQRFGSPAGGPALSVFKG